MSLFCTQAIMTAFGTFSGPTLFRLNQLRHPYFHLERVEECDLNKKSRPNLPHGQNNSRTFFLSCPTSFMHISCVLPSFCLREQYFRILALIADPTYFCTCLEQTRVSCLCCRKNNHTYSSNFVKLVKLCVKLCR